MNFDWRKWLFREDEGESNLSRVRIGASNEELAWDIYLECKRINPELYGYDADSVLNGFWTEGKREAAKMTRAVWDSGHIISNFDDFLAVLEDYDDRKDTQGQPEGVGRKV